MKQNLFKKKFNIIMVLLTLLIVIINSLYYSPDFALGYTFYVHDLLPGISYYFIFYSTIVLLSELFGLSYKIRLPKIFLVLSVASQFI